MITEEMAVNIGDKLRIFKAIEMGSPFPNHNTTWTEYSNTVNGYYYKSDELHQYLTSPDGIHAVKLAMTNKSYIYHIWSTHDGVYYCEFGRRKESTQQYVAHADNEAEAVIMAAHHFSLCIT